MTEASLTRTLDDYLSESVTSRYTSRNILYWLDHWPEFFEGRECQHDVRWLLARLDVLLAVSQLPQQLQDVFQLVAVEQETFYIASWIMGVSQASAQRYWRAMRQNVVFLLMDRTIYSPKEEARRPYPNLNVAVSYEGKFP